MSAQPAQPRTGIGPDLRTRLHVDVLRVGGDEVSVADLVLESLLRDRWTLFVDDVRRGVGLERTGVVEIPSPDLHSAATAFRHRRRLVSAADFRAWLAARGLAVADLAAVLRRDLMRSRHPRGVAAPVADEDVAGVLGAETVCRGELRAAALSVIEGVCAQREASADADADAVAALVTAARIDAVSGLAQLPVAELEGYATRAVARQAARAALAEQVAAPEELAACVAVHGLDWLRLSGRVSTFAHAGAAREARLLVGEGAALAEAAQRADTQVEPWAVEVDQAPEEIAGALMSAVAGDLVGPWEEAGAWRVAVLEARTAASVDDPATHARAAGELLGEALDRLSAGQVEWHVDL